MNEFLKNLQLLEFVANSLYCHFHKGVRIVSGSLRVTLHIQTYRKRKDVLQSSNHMFSEGFQRSEEKVLLEKCRGHVFLSIFLGCIFRSTFSPENYHLSVFGVAESESDVYSTPITPG